MLLDRRESLVLYNANQLDVRMIYLSRDWLACKGE